MPSDGSAPTILSFDTSAAHCVAALLRGGQIVAQRTEEMGRGQAERLIPLLQELLAEAGAQWSDLDAIGVGTGPGNFTGIRISVAAARGLAMSLDIPAVGVPMLDAVALDAPRPVLACLNAPRAQAYVQGHGTAHPVAPQLIAIDRIDRDWAEPSLVCIGPAADAVAAHLDCATAPAAHAPAAAIARIAAMRWRDAPPAPAPLYLKPADAAPASDLPPPMLD